MLRYIWTFCVLYELNIWLNLIDIAFDIAIITIAWFVWKENSNKDYDDFNFENNDNIMALKDVQDGDS